MRLDPEQRETIVRETALVLGPRAKVRLFGSRLRDDVRGGDIDLLVQCPDVVDRPVLRSAQLAARLQRVLGDRRIDVLVIDPSTTLQPVHRVALSQGVELSA
jgi:predicted nucleotidyltransferase